MTSGKADRCRRPFRAAKSQTPAQRHLCFVWYGGTLQRPTAAGSSQDSPGSQHGLLSASEVLRLRRHRSPEVLRRLCASAAETAPGSAEPAARWPVPERPALPWGLLQPRGHRGGPWEEAQGPSRRTLWRSDRGLGEALRAVGKKQKLGTLDGGSGVRVEAPRRGSLGHY